eukprot:1843677-Rhodomonas_salina.1
MTIFPDWKHSSTTGERTGRKMSPGNMFFWNVHRLFMREYMRSMSSFSPGCSGIEALATMFCTSQLTHQKRCVQMLSLSRRVTCLAASTHSYHDTPPVMTSFPLVNRRAVQFGLPMRMVIAAKRFLS